MLSDIRLLSCQSSEKNRFFERRSKSNDLSFSTNMTKKSFIVKYVFFDVEKEVANKTSEVNDEVDDICDDILNAIEVNNANEVNKATLDFFV